MDFTFNQEQEILRDSARRFVASAFGAEYVRGFVDGKESFTEEMWKNIAELGWTAVLIPEEYDGLGLGFVDLAVIIEEMGRGPVPGPFISSVVLAGEALRLAGNHRQKGAYLPKMAAGEVKGTLAWAEPGDLNGLNTVALTATEKKDAFILNGTKIFVPDADLADFVVCAAMTKEGTSLFLVDKGPPGVEVDVLHTMDRTVNLCEVVFNDVEVPKDSLLGTAGEADPLLKQVRNRVNVAYSMDMVGGGQRVLDMGVEYAKTRVQFGQAIGSFQAIKHKTAELLMEVECSRSMVYYAAWAQDQDEREASISASSAKVFSTQMYRNTTKEVLQILGGMGFSWEHDLHIHLKRAKCLGTLFGDVVYHRENIARELGY